MKITRNGQEIVLTSMELYDAFREQERKFLRYDAEAQIREYLGVMEEYDEVSKEKCFKKFGVYPKKDSDDFDFNVEFLDKLCDLFEKRRDCEIGDNYVWQSVLEKYAEYYAAEPKGKGEK